MSPEGRARAAFGTRGALLSGMMMDTQETIALIRNRRDKQQEKARFKAASGMQDDASINDAIVAEYDALLAEIEQLSDLPARQPMNTAPEPTWRH